MPAPTSREFNLAARLAQPVVNRIRRIQEQSANSGFFPKHRRNPHLIISLQKCKGMNEMTFNSFQVVMASL